MKKWSVVPAVLFLVCFSAVTLARDDRNRYSIEEAMNTQAAKEKLNKGYSFQFGPDTQGKIVTNHGEVMVNKKTNAFGKTDRDACNWVFLSAMIGFQENIAKQGGNAVVNIRSYYKKGDFSSSSEFECGNGAIMAGVTFIGDIVTLEQ
ncbi:MAG: excinuclease ABC subunit A [Halioglobus sp.]|nr:excinuclease ABC subunit A [Halioglobus sp.]